MSVYERHVFVCTAGEWCPTIDGDGLGVHARLKALVKQRGLDKVDSILVPVRGGPHAELAIRLARDLGKRFDAQVVVMHIVPKGIGERALAREQACDVAVMLLSDPKRTAEQVARWPQRLVGFCSVSPLESYALPELEPPVQCERSQGLRGVS